MSTKPSNGAGSPKKKPASKRRAKTLIFRRYRTTKSGKVLDAHDYGYKAWPLYV